jgi:hypothetical protein
LGANGIKVYKSLYGFIGGPVKNLKRTFIIFGIFILKSVGASANQEISEIASLLHMNVARYSQTPAPMNKMLDTYIETRLGYHDLKDLRRNRQIEYQPNENFAVFGGHTIGATTVAGIFSYFRNLSSDDRRIFNRLKSLARELNQKGFQFAYDANLGTVCDLRMTGLILANQKTGEVHFLLPSRQTPGCSQERNDL